MSQMKLREPKTKAGRRGNNEGSIYQRKDGRWVTQVTIGYKSDGTPIRPPIYGKTRADVARKMAEKVAEVNKKGYITVSARDERNFQILMSVMSNSVYEKTAQTLDGVFGSYLQPEMQAPVADMPRLRLVK